MKKLFLFALVAALILAAAPTAVFAHEGEGGEGHRPPTPSCLGPGPVEGYYLHGGLYYPKRGHGHDKHGIPTCWSPRHGWNCKVAIYKLLTAVNVENATRYANKHCLFDPKPFTTP